MLGETCYPCCQAFAGIAALKDASQGSFTAWYYRGVGCGKSRQHSEAKVSFSREERVQRGVGVNAEKTLQTIAPGNCN